MPVKTTSRLSATPSPLVSVHFTRSSESVSLVRMTPSWSGRIMRGATSVIDEHGVLVVVAVALGALPAADAADRIVLAAGVGVHHVADHLADVHAAVAVELDERRADDVGIGGDQLHAVAGGQHEARALPRPACARRTGGFGVKSVASLVCAPRPPPKPPARGGGAPAACFAAVPDISYWPSMTAISARMPAPSGVSVIDRRDRRPLHVGEVLEHEPLLPATEMSVTLTVGCVSEATVAVIFPPSSFTVTTKVASNAFIATVTSQSPTKGAICADVGGTDACPAPCIAAVEWPIGKIVDVATTRAARAERTTRTMQITPWTQARSV